MGIRKLQQRFTVSILHEVDCFTLRHTSPPLFIFISTVKSRYFTGQSILNYRLVSTTH